MIITVTFFECNISFSVSQAPNWLSYLDQGFQFAKIEKQIFFKIYAPQAEYWDEVYLS